MRRSPKTTRAVLAIAIVAITGEARAALDAQDDDVVITADPTVKPVGPADVPAVPSAPSAAATPSAAPGASAEPPRSRLEWERAPFGAPPAPGVTIGGYVQAQYETHADSDDQLAQGGTTLNKDRFVLRRTRARISGDWQYAQVLVELDANTVKGPAIGVQKAEATLHYRPDLARPPIAQLTVGLFDTPFGYELVESPRARPFMERTQAARAFWPGEPDLGLRIAGALGFARWTIAAMNGQPLGTTYALQSPVSGKDVIFRVGAETRPQDDLGIGGAVSVLRGKGFHPGTDAAKGAVEWHDLNEDGVVQPFELQALPATGATPSTTFDHWAIGADLEVHYRSRLGVTKVYGEAMIAQNMDRALVVADPVLTSTDSRELGYYVGVTQEVTRWAVAGFRYDYYDPNSDAFDKRAGRLIPFSQRIKTFTPMIAAVLPGRARVVAQYDIIRNFLGRDDSGVPANLKLNTFTLRLQVEL